MSSNGISLQCPVPFLPHGQNFLKGRWEDGPEFKFRPLDLSTQSFYFGTALMLSSAEEKKARDTSRV